MLSFAYPHILWLLWGVALYLLLYFWARYARKKKLERFGKSKWISSLMPWVSPYKPGIKIALECSALALLIIAAARPWGGVIDQKTEKEGIEVVIAMDASNSMLASATSDSNGPQRMRTAKLMLEKLINRFDNDRVGLIIYAGSAYTLIPVTNDYVSAKMFLNSIDPNQIQDQGTNIAGAINLAVSSFGGNKGIGKALILITDAEELDDTAGVMQAAEEAAKNGVQVDVIGVGTTTPVTIPEGKGGVMINPETGAPVETALNEEVAADIAKAGKGIYINASNRDALNELYKQLDKLKRVKFESSTYALHQELFPIFAWLAIIILVIDNLVLDRKIGWLDKITFFKKEKR